MPTSNANGLVFGNVGKRNHEWKEGEKWYKPVADVELTIEGEGRQYQAQSDSEGNFRVENVLPGKYMVKLKLPPGLVRNHWLRTKAQDCRKRNRSRGHTAVPKPISIWNLILACADACWT